MNNCDILRQIDCYIPINGFRVFSETQTGNQYAVTLLSRNQQKCILAEIDDMADVEGVIRIIEF